MFALMIWVNDKPIKGNILKLSAIVDPRKPYGDYEEGEEVKARCHGFGIVKGVFGKIADESGRKQLEDILNGVEFSNLVEEILTHRSTHVSSSVEKASKNENASKNQSTKAIKATEKSEKGKGKNLKRAREGLERAANELELTELEESVQKKVRKDPFIADLEIGQTNTSDVIGESLRVLNMENMEMINIKPPQRM